MKVALVHDYIKEYGGAERVLEALHEIWPKAPIFTSMYLPEYLGPHKKRIEKWDVRPSFLQNIPLKGKLISPLRFIGPHIFKSMDLSEFDVVIVSAAGTYASPNFIKTGKDTLHICYYHTPPRYLYGYPTAAPWKSIWWRRLLLVLGQIPMHFLRMADFKAAQRPDLVIANSYEVAGRIEKFYRRDAKVIYPPVDIPKKPDVKKEDFYLAGGRLARPKRTDLAIKAANKLKIPLKVFGRDFQNYADELKEMAGDTVEFIGEVSDQKKWELMARAKAFIFPAEFEDFGITPVEAMAVGTPVIALKSGGVKESVIDGKTGIFFERPSMTSLVKAINKFEKVNIDGKECMKQAEKFSKDKFVKEIKKLVKENA
jgi:glycosyltransferase involved in cell wall biosynthesis